jgi:4-amino-4-deoxy-L-arabinose transferase-like glycosyltransferase
MTATASPSRAEPPVRGTLLDAPAPLDGLDGSDEPGAVRRRWPLRFGAMVGGAVVVGLALRIAIGLTDDAPSTDETAYLRSGISLVNGHGFVRNGRPELHFPPFVPLLLSLASKVFPNPHTGTVVLTCVASTALIVPLALLARRITGHVAGGVTAWVAALGPGLSTTLVNRGAGSEAEYVLLVVSAVWLVVAAADRRGRGRLLRVAGAGLLVGLAYLTRPEGLFVAGPLGLAAVVLAVRQGRDTGRAGWRPRLRAAVPVAAAFAVPLLACVVPYAAYLHGNTGHWELSAKTQDVSIEAWDAIARGDRRARDQELYRLDATGLHLPTGRSSLPALARDDPSGYAGILWSNVGTLAEEVVNPQQILAWLLLPLPLWALAAVGAWRHRRSGAVALLLAVGALPVATALAFFVQPRYLLMAAGLGTVLVGAGVAALSSRWRRSVVAGAVALLVLSSVQGFDGEAGWGHPSDQTDHMLAGRWIAAHTRPGDRIMARSMVVEYYAHRPTVAIPDADYAHILRFARHYGVQYLVLDQNTSGRLRPQLMLLRLFDRWPGIRLVHESRAEGRTTRVFALDPAPPGDAPMGPSLGFVGDGT